MAQNLTKKLRRQGTDDSHAAKKQRQISQEHLDQLELDESNINVEIIGMLAEEILRKTEFFKLFKENVRGQKGTLQKSQLMRLQAAKERTMGSKEQSVEDMIKDKTKLFKDVSSRMDENSPRVTLPPSVNQSGATSRHSSFIKLPSAIIVEHQKEKKSLDFLKKTALASPERETK